MAILTGRTSHKRGYLLANVLNVRYINAMDVKTINRLLAEGNIDREDMWPRIIEMESKAHQLHSTWNTKLAGLNSHHRDAADFGIQA